MALYSFLAVGFGAALGAWLRWGLGVLLNPFLPSLPPWLRLCRHTRRVRPLGPLWW